MNDLNLVICLLLAAKSTLISITPFGPRGKVQLLFLWCMSAFFAQTRGGVWASPCGALYTSIHYTSKAHIPETATSWKNLGKQVQFPGSQSSHISLQLPPKVDLLFWSDSHCFSLDSFQCFQHPKPQCRIPTVGSSAFSRLFPLCLPGFFSDMSHNALPTLSADQETSQPPRPATLGCLPFSPDPVSPAGPEIVTTTTMPYIALQSSQQFTKHLQHAT